MGAAKRNVQVEQKAMAARRYTSTLSRFYQKSVAETIFQSNTFKTLYTIMTLRKGSVMSVAGGEVRKMSLASIALGAGVLPSTQSAAFDTDSNLEGHYKPIESNEGYHPYDPKYIWSLADERKIIRKGSSNHLCIIESC
jgi:hypothetical protein